MRSVLVLLLTTVLMAPPIALAADPMTHREAVRAARGLAAVIAEPLGDHVRRGTMCRRAAKHHHMCRLRLSGLNPLRLRLDVWASGSRYYGKPKISR